MLNDEIELKKGLNEDVVKEISKIKDEPEWMRNFRLKSYETFKNMPMPNFGPKLDIDFNNITYYKRINDKVFNNWESVRCDVKNTFDSVGLIDAENKYLGGVGAQYDSETVYHNMLDDIKKAGIIFTDTDTALREYPELFKKYFNNLVNYKENKFTALNGCVWSGGSFIYVPKNTKLDRPLQSYFRINTKDMGQFERTIIIVDDNSSLHYIASGMVMVRPAVRMRGSASTSTLTVRLVKSASNIVFSSKLKIRAPARLLPAKAVYTLK